MPVLPYQKLSSLPVEFNDGVSKPETVYISKICVFITKEIGFDQCRSFCPEHIGTCNFSGQPALNGKNPKLVFAVYIFAIEVKFLIFRIKQKVTFPYINCLS